MVKAAALLRVGAPSVSDSSGILLLLSVALDQDGLLSEDF